jgi:succinoglycan biosynthesis transport protein ExoP
MDLSEFLRLLRFRKKLFFAVSGGILGVAIVLAFVLPKVYLGEVSVIVDSKTSDPITGQVLPEQLAVTNLATQTDVITSHNVALKVVDRLHLASIPQVEEQFREDTAGEGSIRDWLADNLLRRLEVKPSRSSNMLTIRFGAGDPGFAATVANAFADAYIQTSMELTSDPARRQSSWFDSQLRELKTSVESAQLRLSDFQRKESMVGTSDDRLDVESTKLGELTGQLVTAQSAMYDARTRLKQMDEALQHDRLDELPDILANPVLQSMKVDLVRAQGNLAQTAQRFDRNHPQYVSAAAQVSALQAKLNTEIQTSKGSITQATQIAERRAGQLQGAVEEQKKHILNLKRRKDQLDVLTREVDAAQHAFDAASQRASEVRLQGHLDQSNIAILNPAIAPLHSYRPSLKLNVAIGLILGVTLATGFILASELVNRRVRSSIDVARAVGLPVIGEVPRLDTRRRVRTRRQNPRLLTAKQASATYQPVST